MQYSSQTGWWSVAIGKSIEWLCMEDCHSVKLSRLLALTVLVLNGSLFRNLTLVCYWASREGSSWADTPSVMFMRGRAAETQAIALDRRLHIFEYLRPVVAYRLDHVDVI